MPARYGRSCHSWKFRAKTEIWAKMARNQKFVLASRPRGHIEQDTFKLVEEPLPQLEDGQMLVRNIWLSLDPAMRGWLRPGRSYVPPVQIGEVMRGSTIGQVIESSNGRYPVGSLILGLGGWQEWCITDGRGWTPISPETPTRYLGVLGITGLTAYFGLLRVGNLQPGETVLVSAAAGAVGSVVGQIAKIYGCRVVGIAGTEEKCKWVRGLGFDEVIDYHGRDEKALAEEIRNACPQGIDVFFDNVGGAILDAALLALRRVICGAISRYNESERSPGPMNYLSLLVNRARMEGFVVFDYAKEYPKDMQSWIAAGKLTFAEHLVDDGLTAAPRALSMLFRGENKGKLILQLAPGPLLPVVSTAQSSAAPPAASATASRQTPARL